MKALWLFLTIISPIIFSACESELPDNSPDMGTRLKRGFRGEGNLYIPENVARPTSPAASPNQF
jgi:hypothetical protein